MKKLKLVLDALRVDTFEPARAEDGSGTVQGHEDGILESTLSVLRPCFNTEQPSCRCT